MGFDALYGLLADNAEAVKREDREQDRPTYCPIDGWLLVWSHSDGLGQSATCPLGNYTWP